MSPWIPAIAMATLAACSPPAFVTRAETNTTAYIAGLTAPEDAAPGTCWNKVETPAVVQTTTEDVRVTPAKMSETGTIQAPPVYRSETRQVIVQERQTLWFERVCAEDLTPDFVASLQRALALRGYYTGANHGRLTPATKGAIRRYQLNAPIAVADPGTLTVEAARRLGLREVAPQAS